MKCKDATKRVRIPELRQEAEGRIAGDATKGEARERISELLGECLVQNLDQPRVVLCGESLPPSHEIDAGPPATSWPDDTYPEVFERVLRSHTHPGEGVLHLFTRSRAPKDVGEILGRRVVLVDEYPSSVEDMLGMDLLQPTEEDLWQVAQIVGAEGPDALAEAFEHLHLHLPMPGLVDRPRLLYGSSQSPSATYWERMAEEHFWMAIKRMLEFWSTLLEPRRLTIRCSFSKWEKTLARMWPQAMQIAEESGWKLDHHWRLDLNPVPGPVRPDALREGWLLSFARSER